RVAGRRRAAGATGRGRVRRVQCKWTAAKAELLALAAHPDPVPHRQAAPRRRAWPVPAARPRHTPPEVVPDRHAQAASWPSPAGNEDWRGYELFLQVRNRPGDLPAAL